MDYVDAQDSWTDWTRKIFFRFIDTIVWAKTWALFVFDARTIENIKSKMNITYFIKRISNQNVCVEKWEMIQSCSIIHTYTKHIHICFIGKSRMNWKKIANKTASYQFNDCIQVWCLRSLYGMNVFLCAINFFFIAKQTQRRKFLTTEQYRSKAKKSI